MTPATVDDVGVLHSARAWLEAGHDVVLATVVQTWGSAPRRPGSHLAIRDDGLFVGSVSGGCVEGAVVEVARGLMGTGGGTVVEYGVTDASAWEVGLACGGTIRVGVCDLGEVRDAFARTVDAVDAREPAALSLRFDERPVAVALGPEDAGWSSQIGHAYDVGRHLIVDEGSPSRFVRVFSPALRMFIIGAVHIAKALVPMAVIAGYDVRVIDPRRAFANPEAWPDVSLVHEYPDEAFEELGLDVRTAVVALTHDPKIDDPGLQAALRSQAFYIGALGSTKTHARRLERLGELGFGADDLARIHGPVGLPIGAATPPEIAISILAEVTAAHRQGGGHSPKLP